MCRRWEKYGFRKTNGGKPKQLKKVDDSFAPGHLQKTKLLQRVMYLLQIYYSSCFMKGELIFGDCM